MRPNKSSLSPLGIRNLAGAQYDQRALVRLADAEDPRVLSSGAVIEQPYAFGMPQQEGHWPVRK